MVILLLDSNKKIKIEIMSFNGCRSDANLVLPRGSYAEAESFSSCYWNFALLEDSFGAGAVDVVVGGQIDWSTRRNVSFSLSAIGQSSLVILLHTAQLCISYPIITHIKRSENTCTDVLWSRLTWRFVLSLESSVILGPVIGLMVNILPARSKSYYFCRCRNMMREIIWWVSQ